MRRHWFPKPYADFVARLRVPGGFLLAAAFLWLSAPTPASLVSGLPVSVLGLVLRAWAAGHLAKNQQLATGGPYAWVRNPLYLGTLVAAAGLSVAARSYGLAFLFAAVFLLVYLPAIELEEQYLRQLFPAFEAYAAQVWLLWPRFRRAPSEARFRWRLYIRNQEYQAPAGFLAAVAVLVWKALAGVSL
jgi:protein-S-isoprenylcysteine O-methyltransferase Ste14